MSVLVKGNQFDLEELYKNVDGFPNGADEFIGRKWIINAIDSGSIQSIEWIINKKVEINFIDEEGRSPLMNALERRPASRYQVLELLLDNGADPNLQGVNYTAAHLAAIRDDVEALEILHDHGADFSIRTRIDHCLTPLEEAISCKKKNAIEYLKKFA